MARYFKYTYEGQTIIYIVIDEEAKTCRTNNDPGAGFPGNYVSGSLVLPANPKDGDVEYTLTEIGSGAFLRCSELTSVEIPNSVTSIGNGAFAGCNGLKKAEFASIKDLCLIDFVGNNWANPLNFAHHLYINGEEVTEVVA